MHFYKRVRLRLQYIFTLTCLHVGSKDMSYPLVFSLTYGGQCNIAILSIRAHKLLVVNRGGRLLLSERPQGSELLLVWTLQHPRLYRGWRMLSARSSDEGPFVLGWQR